MSRMGEKSIKHNQCAELSYSTFKCLMIQLI